MRAKQNNRVNQPSDSPKAVAEECRSQSLLAVASDQRDESLLAFMDEVLVDLVLGNENNKTKGDQ